MYADNGGGGSGGLVHTRELSDVLSTYLIQPVSEKTACFDYSISGIIRT